MWEQIIRPTGLLDPIIELQKTEGVYVAPTFDSEFNKVTKLDRKVYTIENVIRHMIVWKGGELLPDLEENNE